MKKGAVRRTLLTFLTALYLFPHKATSLGYPTRWECCMKYVLKSYEKRRNTMPNSPFKRIAPLIDYKGETNSPKRDRSGGRRFDASASSREHGEEIAKRRALKSIANRLHSVKEICERAIADQNKA